MNKDNESSGRKSKGAGRLRERLESEIDRSVEVYSRSIFEKGGQTFALARVGDDKHLLVEGRDSRGFAVGSTIREEGTPVHVCPRSPENAERLRELFSWTGPEPLGKTSAVGCGDRLGCATPGHIRACRAHEARPVLAQQSIREMERTGRTPQEVLDDVTWAVFQEGYTEGFGADADHLKNTDDIDSCLEAGYTMYTIDPSNHVNNEADSLDSEELEEAFEALPWDTLDTSPQEWEERYLKRQISVEGNDDEIDISLDGEALMRAAVKYGAALAHTGKMAEYLAQQYAQHRADETYDLEMSVDETETPTAPHEHFFVASELERLGVEVTSLAPRFVGDFEKGIDYIGDLSEFEASFRKHAAIAQAFGGYKLSIHSGSDKFSVYPIIGDYAGGHVHLKTAGTSFLEALRIPARHDADFFRRIVDFAFDRFAEDRATYHVSTDLSVIPSPEEVADEALETTYLEEDNGRQLLHITYGSILSAKENGSTRFKGRFLALLNEHENEHYDVLQSHLSDHIEGIGTMAT